MKTDLLRTFYDYNTWANERILTACAGLSDMQFVTEGSASFSSNGKPIGFYIPAPHASQEKMHEDLAHLAAAVKRALDETGMTENELADFFDLNKPL